MKALCILALAALLSAGCVMKSNFVSPLMELEPKTYKVHLGVEPRAVVKAGAVKAGWEAETVGDDGMRCTYVNGIHKVIVHIKFTRDEFTITYYNSENMSYDPKTNTIHKDYNKLIGDLEHQIANIAMTH